MNRQEFEHIIKACANATNGHEFLIIGSQAILGSVPDAPRELRVSMELDVCPLPFTESAAATIDGNIGELTRFHETFRIYAHAVGPETATLPVDFNDRLVELQVGAVSVRCLAPVDLAYSKLAAGRQKDLEYIVGLLHHKIVRRSELQRLVHATPDREIAMEDRLKIVLTRLGERREVTRQQSREGGRGMSL
ncbi:MAG: hypothetical protein JOZ31_16155 [Verrucomicrobia bacterium]|nr:hypothetical protein [Verrucomicrobiota bacterium]